MIQNMANFFTDFISHILSSSDSQTDYQSALIKRRNRRFFRKIILSIFVFLLSMLIISAISAIQETQNVLIATKSIAVGERITKSHVRVISVPKHSVFKKALTSYSQNSNITAICNIESGMPILANEISNTPNVPRGYTAVNVTLASANQTFQPGEIISIAFAQSQNDIKNEYDEGENSQKNNGKDKHSDDNNKNYFELDKNNKNFKVIKNVLIIRTPNNQHIATLAMSASQALDLLNAQSITPTLAIVAIKK